MKLISLIVSTLLSCASLLYSGILIDRLYENNLPSTHIGRDVFIICHIAAVGALIFALAAKFSTTSAHKNTVNLVVFIGVLALFTWSLLYITGRVVAHA